MKKIIPFFAFLAIWMPGTVSAQLKVANIFSDHMVLQRNQPVKVWGQAAPRDRVVVYLNGEAATVRADRNGAWMAQLPAMPAGGPFNLVVRTRREQKSFEDVLIGDVWLAGGQSNMEWPIVMSAKATEEIAAANNPEIRHIRIEHVTSVEPLNDLTEPGKWLPATSANAPGFSAVGWFFARELNKETGVPIGILSSNWGGTMVETWMSRDYLDTLDAFREITAKLPASVAAYQQYQKGKFEPIVNRINGSTDIEKTAGWNQPAFDDSRWNSLEVPAFWEAQGYAGLDGEIWYRRQVTLTAEQAALPATLNLGMIDDCDITYINGQKVGETCTWNERRSYKIPTGILKAGANSIAVKVIDGGGNGGMHGEAADFNLTAGSTPISLAGKWKARVDASTIYGKPDPNSMPSLLYNAMIHPIEKFPITGVIFYQGETNAGRAAQYQNSFASMITNWRQKFNQPDMPFYFVQLASYNADNKNDPSGSAWAELREAQRQTLNLKNTGMAVTTDIGDPGDIHPRNKQDVGRRLALWALHDVYGKTDLVYSGPMYKSARQEGQKMIVSFDHTGSGLMVKDKYGYLKGFMVAGADQQFHWAKAQLRGNEVEVWSDEVANPTAVRYGWVDNAEEANLFNREGLPASPFRTDNWKRLTENARYEFQ